MADFLKKRLQIFVSSTYVDLKVERQAAVMAILEAGHIPAGMELFTAGDETQWDTIKQWIDQSDAYFLILGGRYGSVDPATGKSYTHLEYEYAIEKGKPVFACVVDDKAQEQRVKDHGVTVIEQDCPKELKAFRTLVLSKMSEFWSDTKDIQLAVHKKLSELSRREDLVGWVRPNEQTNVVDLTNEMTRLSKENADLRSNIGTEVRYAGLTFDEMVDALKETEGLLEFFLERGRYFSFAKAMAKDSVTASNLESLSEIGLMNCRYEFPYLYSELSLAGKEFLNQLSRRDKLSQSGQATDS